jgi:hypothetical protein
MAKTKSVVNLLIEKTYFESNQQQVRFQKEKTYSKNTLWTVGLNL